jgi:hypothetical protein
MIVKNYTQNLKGGIKEKMTTETTKQKSIKNFNAESLRELLNSKLKDGVAVFPINDAIELYTGKTDKTNFKLITSMVRNGFNNLLAIDYNKPISEIKQLDVYSRNKTLCVINLNNLSL